MKEVKDVNCEDGKGFMEEKCKSCGDWRLKRYDEELIKLKKWFKR